MAVPAVPRWRQHGRLCSWRWGRKPQRRGLERDRPCNSKPKPRLIACMTTDKFIGSFNSETRPRQRHFPPRRSVVIRWASEFSSVRIGQMDAQHLGQMPRSGCHIRPTTNPSTTLQTPQEPEPAPASAANRAAWPVGIKAWVKPMPDRSGLQKPQNAEQLQQLQQLHG